MGLEVINLNRFPERLKEFRESKGLTMAELSRIMGSISQAALSIMKLVPGNLVRNIDGISIFL